jgi:hypothetical protein
VVVDKDRFRKSEKQMTVKKSKTDFCRSWMSYGHVVGLPGSGSGEGWFSSEGVGVGGG